MKSGVLRYVLFAPVLLCAVLYSGAQQRSVVPAATDPRVGLKAGFFDAGVAARNMELVRNIPRPEGFFDPKAPAGTPTPPDPPNAQGQNASPDGAPNGVNDQNRTDGQSTPPQQQA